MSASTTRTTLAQTSGGRTQLVGVIGAALVALVLVVGTSVIADLPTAALAAVVIAAALSLFDIPSVRWLASVRRTELILSLLASAGVLFVGVLEGIAIAVFLSIANFLRRAWRPYHAILGRIDGRKGYHDVERHPDALQIPGLVLFRFDAPLFFANADYFADQVRAGIDGSPPPIRRVIVAAEPITDVDTTAAEMLTGLIDELEERGIDLAFAELKGPVKDRLARYGLLDRIGPRNFPSTLGRALDAYLEASGVEWVDWTDRP